MQFYFPGDDFMDTVSNDQFNKGVFEKKSLVDKNSCFVVTGTPLDDNWMSDKSTHKIVSECTS